MKQQNYIIVLLGLLAAIGPFSIDMYLPAFPAIAADLKTSISNVSLSLSSFFIGISAGQFIYGPLLDKVGRKKPLYGGLVIYCTASLACMFASSANALIALRLVQALGGCVGIVASRTIVRDLFTVSENAKIFSQLMLVIGISPIVAPLFGSYITATLGWQYIFLILALISLVLLISVYFLLPESKPSEIATFAVPDSGKNIFLTILKEPQFYKYAISGSCSSACLYVYLADSPFVFMKLYGMTEQHYGWIFAILAGGLISASQLNRLLLKRYKSEWIVRRASLMHTLTALILFLSTLFGYLHLYGILLLIFILLSCQGFISPNSSAQCMAPFSKNTGRAAALLGSMQMFTGGFASLAVNLVKRHSILPMTTLLFCFSLLSFLVLRKSDIIKKYFVLKIINYLKP
ncbi:DHA1 family bicyclomycin/chloramphenicol resistance-like MFS transporter [Chitinophaga niastensis]|uniref:DHA1 family bicyclomycin/chloramphenicol resistance-like MFS transporter n=1 Tax=Chitinophaga niastensis TaxID=536980 RepID=A0A2P8HVW5_CHINA|nr:multidrug effflux MFS transporter [Chitinophaga niastensis]PSL50304.1 DHA1 family bicyclomycin/chloramphenicol resistance-like MFS transporter [Chitinophaga niastensis]